MGGAKEEFAKDPEKRQVRGRRHQMGGYPSGQSEKAFPKRVRKSGGQSCGEVK